MKGTDHIDHCIIYKSTTGFTHTLHVRSKDNDMFEGRVRIEVDEESITLKRTGISHTGKSHKFNCHQKNWHSTTIPAGIDIPLGHFYFDKEETNEDEIVIYFDQDQD